MDAGSAIGISLLTILFFVWACELQFLPGQRHRLSAATGPLGSSSSTGHRPTLTTSKSIVRVEFTVMSLNAVLPFPYPPPFLIPVTPFSLLPYMWAFAAWFDRHGPPLFLLQPGASSPEPMPSLSRRGHQWMDRQNGFLTSAIFVTGTRLLEMRPFVGGAILGILVIKPQLCAAFAGGCHRRAPVACGRRSSSKRRYPPAPIATAIRLGRLRRLLEDLPLYTDMMRQDAWPWNEFISVFAFLRWFGIGQVVASTIHALVAVAAIALDLARLVTQLGLQGCCAWLRPPC